MTNEEILKKAIEKAFPKEKPNMWRTLKNDLLFGRHYYELIFSHTFAKSFFEEKDMWKETECTCGGVDFHIGGYDMHKMDCARIKAERGYKYHLQAMVICENPLEYLAKFL